MTRAQRRLYPGFVEPPVHSLLFVDPELQVGLCQSPLKGVRHTFEIVLWQNKSR